MGAATRPDDAPAGTVVLGGGFAGASVARELGHRGCTLVTPSGELAYTPLLPEAASGEIKLDRVAVPLRVVCPRASIVTGVAVGVDLAGRAVEVRAENGKTLNVRYENLVVAVGAVDRIPSVPGLENVLGVRTIESTLRTRNHILAQLAAAARETDPATRLWHLTFTVVGGGYAGVEALAELLALAQDAARDLPSLRGVPQRWVLVDAAETILSDIPGRLGEYAAGELVRRGVEVRTATTLEAVENGVAVMSDGTRVPTATIVWAAGASAHPLLADLGLPVDDRGRLLLEPTLRVAGEPTIWAAGDCAAVPNAGTPGRLDPPTSQHALRQARRIARNIVAVSAGRPPEAYRFLQLGQVATLGRYHGVADVLGLQLKGLPGWVAARAVHLMQYPDPLGRLAIVNDWTLSLLFRRDVGVTAEPENDRSGT